MKKGSLRFPLKKKEARRLGCTSLTSYITMPCVSDSVSLINTISGVVAARTDPQVEEEAVSFLIC